MRLKGGLLALGPLQRQEGGALTLTVPLQKVFALLLLGLWLAVITAIRSAAALFTSFTVIIVIVHAIVVVVIAVLTKVG